jgi:hypothetical protein
MASVSIFTLQGDGKRPLERDRRIWEANNKMNVKETGSQDMNWILLDQEMDQWHTVTNMVMSF